MVPTALFMAPDRKSEKLDAGAAALLAAAGALAPMLESA
jgi:hypothetical protein